MDLIRGLHNVRARHRGSVVTIGNFDGVHLGHRAILSQLDGLARAAGLPAALIIFEPQPQEFFLGPGAPPRLTRLREKISLLGENGLQRLLVMRFDRALSAMTPDAFIRRVLVEGLGVRQVVVGDDFRFGHKGEGNAALLRDAGAAHGFEVWRQDTFEVEGERVSSSRVRRLLGQGEFGAASALLGRRYRIGGRVAQGQRLGRTIGFPTANIELKRLGTPLSGVYAVTVHGISGDPLTGVANLGKRPTVDGTRRRLEVHVFDFDRDIYGQCLEVEFVSKLRDEQRFDSLDALKAQIGRDASQARALFEARR